MFVYGAKESESEAIYISLSSIPTTRGEPLRIARISPFVLIATTVFRPSSCLNAFLNPSSNVFDVFNCSSRSLTITSVSVWVVNSYSFASNSLFNLSKFSTIPFCTNVNELSVEMCGCALLTVTPPCVAHLVCPIAVVDCGSLLKPLSGLISPIVLNMVIFSLVFTAIPHES